MPILRIEHGVRDFDAWKREGFDRDPLGREQSGVRRYRVMRQVDDPQYVMVDLEFDSAGEAQAFADGLRKLWGRIDLDSPRARIVEAVETKEY